MKVLHYAQNGDPWDVVTLQDHPAPKLAPGQVMVRLEAMPLHIGDIMMIRGQLGSMPQGPGFPGFEGVGHIIEAAPDVDQSPTGWPLGTRVLLPMSHGAARELQAHESAALMRVPEGPDAAQMALVRINLSTAWLLLHGYETLNPGGWIIQNAANSNVGFYIARLARIAGLNVINLVRRPELIPPLKAEGREHVFLDDETVAAKAAALNAAPALAFDAIGGSATARLGNVVARSGHIISYGFLSKQPHQLDYNDLVFRNVRLSGMLTNRPLEDIGEQGRARMDAELQSFIEEGNLQTEIAAIYPFAEAAAAFRHANETGPNRTGKIILIPG